MSYDPLLTLIQHQQKEIEERLSPRTFDHQSAQLTGWRAEQKIAVTKSQNRRRSLPSIADVFPLLFLMKKVKSRWAHTSLLQPGKETSSTN